MKTPRVPFIKPRNFKKGMHIALLDIKKENEPIAFACLFIDNFYRGLWDALFDYGFHRHDVRFYDDGEVLGWRNTYKVVPATEAMRRKFLLTEEAKRQEHFEELVNTISKFISEIKSQKKAQEHRRKPYVEVLEAIIRDIDIFEEKQRWESESG